MILKFKITLRKGHRKPVFITKLLRQLLDLKGEVVFSPGAYDVTITRRVK